jgi:DNA-3-methyladenine glycosylase II
LKGEELEKACRLLARRDPVLKTLYVRNGAPQWRRREAGYPGLARIIIEQQLSVASANAILGRVKLLTEGLRPEALLRVEDTGLRAAGLSRPKIRYVRALAEEVLSERFSFASLTAMDEPTASERLERLLGVGRWTAAVYLLFCEGRSDLWPRRDVALLAAHQAGGGSFGRSEIAEFDTFAEQTYAPYRGIAAHLLWSEIARIRGRAPA